MEIIFLKLEKFGRGDGKKFEFYLPVLVSMHFSGKSGSKEKEEFQKLNDAYQRLMYAAKFPDQNPECQSNRRTDYYGPSYRASSSRHYRDWSGASYSNLRYNQNKWQKPYEDAQKVTEAQSEILRKAFTQLFIGFIVVQLFLASTLPQQQDVNSRSGSGCLCAMCYERTQRLAEEKKQKM